MNLLRSLKPAVVLSASLVTGAIAALRRNKRQQAIPFLVGVPLAIAVSTIIKKLVDEPRPPGPKLDEGESFPSGHASAMAAYATTLATWSGKWWAFPLAGAAIAATDLSRVRERDHWPHDVVAGDMLGVLSAAIGELLARASARYRGPHRAPHCRVYSRR
jgi:membrane-associated phospholipid phosphatase